MRDMNISTADPYRSLIAGIYHQAVLDVNNKSGKLKREARLFLASKEAISFIQWLDIEPDGYRDYVKRL